MGGWINYQVTWDGTTISTYINGVFLGSRTSDYTSIDNGTPYIIGGSSSGNTFMNGEIGELRIYNYKLNPNAVAADYLSAYLI